VTSSQQLSVFTPEEVATVRARCDRCGAIGPAVTIDQPVRLMIGSTSIPKNRAQAKHLAVMLAYDREWRNYWRELLCRSCNVMRLRREAIREEARHQ